MSFVANSAWTVADATVGDSMNVVSEMTAALDISGADAEVWTYIFGGILDISDGGRMVVPSGGSLPQLITGFISLSEGAALEAESVSALVQSLTVDASTVEAKELLLIAALPGGMIVRDGADAVIVEKVEIGIHSLEYGGEENELSVTGIMSLGLPDTKIRMEELGSNATLTLGVSRLDVETDLSEDTTAAQSRDTSGVTLGVIPPADPGLENAGDIEVMNVLWDVDTAEPLIFCDTHTNKWAGFVVKEDATANLVDGNFNGYYGALYSDDEVLNVLGDVLVADGTTLNTDGHQIIYTGSLVDDGTIDTPGNLIHVDARHFGDFNADGLINNADYHIIRDSYSNQNDTDDPRCDSDGDNDSDAADYALFAANRTAYASDSLCEGGESFGGGGGSGCSSEVALTEEQEAWVADTIAWCLETPTEELIAATAEAFAASTAYTSDPAECQMSALVAAGLCGS